MVFAIVLYLATASTQASAFDHSHKVWNEVLSRYMVSGEFKYKELKEAPKGSNGEFRNYLDQIEAVTAKEYGTFSRSEQMAFLINAYNAMTVKLIIDHYPVKSIKDIGGLFKKPWSIEFFKLLGGAIRSIDPIEHEYLRPKFKDYRIHAAVNCASKSCPELRREAFVPERLDAQLDEQMHSWLTDTSRNKVEPAQKTIWVSQIFDWYEEDFEAWGSGVTKVLIKHAPSIYKSPAAAGYKIKYLDYDWNLNESSAPKSERQGT